MSWDGRAQAESVHRAECGAVREKERRVSTGGTWLHGGMVQVPAAAAKRGLQRWRICAEGQILSSSQGERGDAVLQQNFKNEVSLERQTVP